MNMYDIISKKRDGFELKAEETGFFIKGICSGDIPDYQAAALLMAMYIRGLNAEELAHLTQAMMNSGEKVPLHDVPGKKIDKHSTGGVGDKVSFIVAPMVAACGVKVPMLSGRGLGHTGGTLDKLESIPGMQVFLQPQEIKRVLSEVGMVICGQTGNIVPADKKLYALRDAIAAIASMPLITASIMSKKLALQSDGIVLDVKTGRGAFMSKTEDAINLLHTMVETGNRAGRKTSGLITRMDQPLGLAVGNSLEIIESIETLKGRGPADLLEVSLAVGTCMLLSAGITANTDEAEQLLKKALNSGTALEIFKKFIAAQGGDARVCDDYRLFPGSTYRVPLSADKSGFIYAIDALETGLTAVDIGAGRRKKEDSITHSAGFLFEKKTGEAVKKGECLVTIYANHLELAEKAKERLRQAIPISREPVQIQANVLYRCC